MAMKPWRDVLSLVRSIKLAWRPNKGSLTWFEIK
jgi:hypothetical protein